MSFIKDQLSKSETIRHLYNSGRQTVSRTYRSIKTTDRTDKYRTLRGENSDQEKTIEDETGLFNDGMQLEPHPDASNPVLTKDDIDDVLTRFVADPFIVYRDGMYHMFFEIKCVGGDVFIGHAFSKDGIEYTYNKTVIEPEFAEHTYPYVFQYEGDWLMVPSPGGNVKGQFRIYEATDFPTEWRLKAIPIRERVRQDPTPIQSGDTWFLIYQDTDNWNVILKYANSLTDSGWKTHPDSPIFRNNPEQLSTSTIGRAEMVSSGRPIYNEESVDVVYRSHLNRETYHYRITDLSVDTFEQHRHSKRPIFQDQKRDAWNQRFMHTVNPLYPWIPDDSLVAVDGLEEDKYRWSIGIYTLA